MGGAEIDSAAASAAALQRREEEPRRRPSEWGECGEEPAGNRRAALLPGIKPAATLRLYSGRSAG